MLNCNLLLIQQNVDESHFFNRSWAEFKVRFNDSGGNYWLGNDLFHKLTTSGRYELRFDLQALDNGDWYYAMYTMRQPITWYSGYSGNAGKSRFSYHDRSMFTTYDRDNDPWTHEDPQYRNNCAFYMKMMDSGIMPAQSYECQRYPYAGPTSVTKFSSFSRGTLCGKVLWGYFHWPLKLWILSQILNFCLDVDREYRISWTDQNVKNQKTV